MGDIKAAKTAMDLAIRAHHLPHEWSEAVADELSSLPQTVSAEDCAGRMDVRDLPFVTIDGEDAKDFDDAVYAHAHQDQGWVLYVAIADVAHYVQLGSALDETAAERATSAYFPNGVLPMLPEALSNELCSLKPKEDRLVLLAVLHIGAKGDLKDYHFHEAVIHSKARLTYSEVAGMMEKQRAIPRFWQQSLQALRGCVQALQQQEDKRGVLHFDTVETAIRFDRHGEVKTIVPVHRNAAHLLIESCMLAANVAAARALLALKQGGLFRVHPNPDATKVQKLREFLQPLALQMPEKPKPKDFQQLLKDSKQRLDAHIIQMMCFA